MGNYEFAVLFSAALTSALPVTQSTYASNSTGVFAAAVNATIANTRFPIPDGFPRPNPQQIEAIERGAGGTLPNTPIPKFHSDTYKSLQLIATNEMIEVSLYEQCLIKIQNGGPGFEAEQFGTPEHRQFVINTFQHFYNQEEIHSLIGQGGLQANGQPPVKPSTYLLDTSTYQLCLQNAITIGDNVLGTSQGVINQAITAGDGGLAAQLDSLIAQEGQQAGFLRSEQIIDGQGYGRVPAAMPAYTASTREYLFSLLEQSYIKPGSDTNNIQIPVNYRLTATIPRSGSIQPIDQSLEFTVYLDTPTGNNANLPNVNWNDPNLYLTYIAGQNFPLSVAIQNLHQFNDRVVFNADFPAYTNIIDAFALAAVTKGNQTTNTCQQASDASVAGPATLELTN